ncbi:MAG: uncharacterized protein JWM10_4206 [Myxococcaceae bacterium]|nr:uncharacterized protein [Myxococcaceae bacterium]
MVYRAPLDAKCPTVCEASSALTHPLESSLAFVRGDGGSIGNRFLIDRAGFSTEREAWTQSHEAGHILLDQPWHPDNMGPDRPSPLMQRDDVGAASAEAPRYPRPAAPARVVLETGVNAAPLVTDLPAARDGVRWGVSDGPAGQVRRQRPRRQTRVRAVM